MDRNVEKMTMVSKVLISLIGLSFVIGSIVYGLSLRESISESISYPAVVVNMDSRVNHNSSSTKHNKTISIHIGNGTTFSDPEYVYYPIVSFKHNDEIITFTSDSGQSPARYKLKDKVVVLYNVDKGTYIIDSGLMNYIIPIALLFIGIILILVGLFGDEKEIN